MAELEESVVRALVMRYASLMARLRGEIGERPLVLPNSKFFPDEFKGDEASLRRLIRRMQKHAGITDIPVKPALVDPEDGAEAHHGGGCGSGACAAPRLESKGLERVVPAGDGWQLRVAPGELRHPVVLTANVARALGYVFLMETLAEGESIEQPVDLSIELAAIALGFGELLLEGSHIYAKSCGGPSIASVTSLGPEELSLITVLFISQGKHSARAVRAELPVTQREAFDEAKALIDSNPKLVELMARAPERVARGDFELDRATPWLTRVFKKKRAGDELSLAELEADLGKSARARANPSKVAADPDKDELRALVDEALMTPRT